ncbi:MAG: CBS domain-containing protein, partial [Pyrinomonadaceae bacterium]
TDLATVKADTPLHLAWALLVKHRIKALPVVNAPRNIIGIVTQTDFMVNANWDRDGDLNIGLARRLRRAVKLDRRTQRTVADIMTSEVHFVRPETLVTELVPAMADRGLHHLPVADENEKLVGIVTQSDVIAALYNSNLSAGRPDEPLTLAG